MAATGGSRRGGAQAHPVGIALRHVSSARGQREVALRRSGVRSYLPRAVREYSAKRLLRAFSERRISRLRASSADFTRFCTSSGRLSWATAPPAEGRRQPQRSPAPAHARRRRNMARTGGRNAAV